MIAWDGYDGDARLMHPNERLEHEPIRLGSRRAVIVDVTGKQHRVDVLLARDAHDLGEGLAELLGPGPSPDRSPHVPVGRVQQPHGESLLGEATRITSVEFASGIPRLVTLRP